MRRYAWLLAAAVFACSSSPDDPNLVTQPTRVRVSPSAFLGSTPCTKEGGMQRYQATLVDVTDGLEEAFILPHSSLVPCTADVEFQFVRPGRLYIARVKGYDRSDLEVAVEGSPIIRDEDGNTVEPRWETTCWGHDGVNLADLGLGGAGLGGASEGAGGAGPDLGVKSFAKTVVTVRGCEKLQDRGRVGAAFVAISIASSLVDVSCGAGPGDVGSFRIADEPADPEALGGAGGLGGAGPDLPTPPTAPCGQTLLIETAASAGQVSFPVEGLDAETGEVIWASLCHAVPREGITVTATCDPARAL